MSEDQGDDRSPSPHEPGEERGALSDPSDTEDDAQQDVQDVQDGVHTAIIILTSMGAEKVGDESSPEPGNVFTVGMAPTPTKRKKATPLRRVPRPVTRNPTGRLLEILGTISAEERRAWGKAPPEQRARWQELSEHIDGGCAGPSDLPLRFRLLESPMPASAKKVALARATQMQRMGPYSGDAVKMQTWMDKLLSIPFGRYSERPDVSEAPTLLRRLQETMDQCVHGLAPVKRWILQAVAQWISSPGAKGLVLGIQGPPGVGKTSLVRGIASTLGRPFQTLNMGGYRDSACLTGHDMTYVGSTPGALAEALVQAGRMDPVLYFDEVDKIGQGGHGGQGGEDIAGVLVHLTDEMQNHDFQDRYFGPGIPLDFSRCIFIFSFNHLDQVDPVLRNRMTVVQIPALQTSDKVEIAMRYLWPSLCKELALSPETVPVPVKEVVQHILEKHCPPETGVRVLKSRLRMLLQAHQMARLLEDNVPWAQVPWNCQPDHCDALLEPFANEDSGKPPPGMYL